MDLKYSKKGKISKERKIFEAAVIKEITEPSLDENQLLHLFNAMANAEKEIQFPPKTDVAGKFQDYKITALNNFTSRFKDRKSFWQVNIFVPRNYGFPFISPPDENLYFEELPPFQVTIPNFKSSKSSRDTGFLVSNVATNLVAFDESLTAKSGIYILFKATLENVGPIGRAIFFTHRSIWSTNIACITLNRGIFFNGTAKMSASIEMTVDEHDNSTGNNEPIIPNKSFLLKDFESTGDFREDTPQIKLNSGEVEHGFFAQPGRIYRLGVIARVDISHNFRGSRGSIKDIKGAVTFHSVLNMNVKSITIKNTL